MQYDKPHSFKLTRRLPTGEYTTREIVRQKPEIVVERRPAFLDASSWLLFFGSIMRYFMLWISGRRTTTSQEMEAVRTAQTLDNGDIEDDDVVLEGTYEPRQPERRMAVRYAIHAKVELALERTNADRMTVRKFIFTRARQANMRITDIANFIDLAVELSFVPSVQEIEAMAFRNTSVVIDRVDLINSGITTQDQAWARWFWRKPRTAQPFRAT